MIKRLLVACYLVIGLNSASAQWNPQNTGITEPFYQSCFLHPDTGFAVTAAFSTGGKIMRTVDGQNWTQVLATSSYLFTVDFPSHETGYAAGGTIGSSGAVFKTSNGGSTWQQMTAGMQQVYSICFVNDTIGYAATNNATNGTYSIYKTVDGAASWQLLKSGSDYIRHVFFPSDSVGYIAGDNGRIFKTTDAGQNWSLLPTGIVFHYNESYFLNDTLGWVVGAYGPGACYKTTNGGATWVKQTIPTTKALTSVFFSDQLNGWASGDSGVILKTVNGGASWQIVSSGTINSLLHIQFPQPGVGYVVGSNGTIRKFSATSGTTAIFPAAGYKCLLYPNPSASTIHLSTEQVESNRSVDLFDAAGRMLLANPFPDTDLDIDVSTFPVGVYYLRINGSAASVLRFLKCE